MVTVFVASRRPQVCYCSVSSTYSKDAYVVSYFREAFAVEMCKAAVMLVVAKCSNTHDYYERNYSFY